MLSVALWYQKAIDAITADKGLKLQKFELDEDKWKVIEDLIDILKVCQYGDVLSSQIHEYPLAIQKGDNLLFKWHD